MAKNEEAGMRIEKTHGTTKEEAVKKIDGFLQELIQRQFPGGVTIRNPRKVWKGDYMSFSFEAKKSWVPAQTIAGTLNVDAEKVVLDANLPGMVATFVPEEKVRQVIDENFAKLFPQVA